jgi:hypothetical protein
MIGDTKTESLATADATEKELPARMLSSGGATIERRGSARRKCPPSQNGREPPKIEPSATNGELVASSRGRNRVGTGLWKPMTAAS